MRRQSNLTQFLLCAAVLGLVGALAVTAGGASRVSAQSASDTWDTPINLSQSGVATDPAILVDAALGVHGVWQDTFGNFVYAHREGDQWTAPKLTNLHVLFGSPATQTASGDADELLYTGPNPRFIAGTGSYSMAFWISPQGSLYASRVLNRSFTDAFAWSRRKLVASSVATFAVAVDARGLVHLAFIRTTNGAGSPAGLYYVRSRNDGLDWSTPTLQYASAYFRGLAVGEANISLATAGTAEAPLVYIAWDNRARRQVFLVKSVNGGVDWEAPVQVAGPARGSGSTGPYNIRVGAAENGVVLLWQNGQAAGACTQLYAYSVDAGATWSDAQLMSDDFTGCAQSNEFVTGLQVNPQGYLYLLTAIKSQVFLSAWDGTRWSEPQAQPTLSAFEDPELFTQVDYQCHQATWLDGQLYIIGCDVGGGGDIWVTSRGVESATAWFSIPEWSRAAAVTNETYTVTNLELVATGDNLVHALFSQRQDPAIYYTRWDGSRWARITPVLELPDGNAGGPAIATGLNNELLVVVRSSSGSLYFSRASSSNALTASAWSTPVRLATAQDAKVGWADIALNAAGTISVAYATPVNEGRGIYVTQSTDAGKSWSKAVQIFDGAMAGSELVGMPSLLVSSDGTTHIIWTEHAIDVDGNSQPVALYYSQSADLGRTFSAAERVLAAPVSWSQIVTDGNGNLHRLWRRTDMQTSVWDQVSTDGGLSWQTAQRLPTQEGGVAVTTDAIGRLHLVGAGPSTLGHWLWDGSRWQAQAPLNWASAAPRESPVGLLAATISMDGKLAVLWAVPTGSEDGGARQFYFAHRSYDTPANQPITP